MFDYNDCVPVKEFEGKYVVNKAGQVARVPGYIVNKNNVLQYFPGKVLKPYQGQVYLSSEGEVTTKVVKELVAEAYMEGYYPGRIVFHKKGLSDNLDNLSFEPSYETNETWKDIPGYEGYYQASAKGEIRSIDRAVIYECESSVRSMIKRGKLISQTADKSGYLHVGLTLNDVTKLCSVHRLVAQTFIPNPENKPQVNHIDGNTSNNSVENLEWVTRSENMQHAKNTGLWDPKYCGYRSTLATGKPVICINDNNREFSSISAASRYYGMDGDMVKRSAMLNKPTKGWYFKFKE